TLPWTGLFRPDPVLPPGGRRNHSQDIRTPGKRRDGSDHAGTGGYCVLLRPCGHLHWRRPDDPCAAAGAGCLYCESLGKPVVPEVLVRVPCGGKGWAWAVPFLYAKLRVPAIFCMI